MNIELLSFGQNGWGDEMLRGAAMTLVIAVLGFIGGLLLGLPIAAARLSSSRPLRGLATVYVTVIRGVPELLVIYVLFFGGSQFFRSLALLFGYSGKISVDAFFAGLSALTLIAAAYAAEVFRGAIQAIPKGQIEAAKAFGMSPAQMLRHITIPLMLRYVIPSLANVWQLILKDTALISVTGLVELMRMTDVAAGSTRSPFIFFTVAILIFLAFTAVSNKVFSRVESHFTRHVNRRGAL